VTTQRAAWCTAAEELRQLRLVHRSWPEVGELVAALVPGISLDVDSLTGVVDSDFLAVPPAAEVVLTIRPSQSSLRINVSDAVPPEVATFAVLHAAAHIVLGHVIPGDQGGHWDTIETIAGKGQRRRWDRAVYSFLEEVGVEGDVNVQVEAREVPTPHPIQAEALRALAETRQAGNGAGLVVLATGLGKTWLAAFDCDQPEFKRVLFVAHREEILRQAAETFSILCPTSRIGLYAGDRKQADADIVLASVMTLGRRAHLDRFPADAFDYIVVDEFHHAAARTYRQLIAHFEPKFLLGLTATPERTDGGDLLGLCQENLVYRCNMNSGIARGLLCPFKYYGIPDIVDYERISWRNNRFDEAELTTAVATQQRAQHVLDQYRRLAGHRTLAFCCSKRHADFMATYFSDLGVTSVAVHSGPSSADRIDAVIKLGAGTIDVIFSVDVVTVEVEVPAIDTVMMLRPTESSIIWTQQFGRGLRVSEGKEYLKVIDYIGNHRIFLNKPRTLFALPPGDMHLHKALAAFSSGQSPLPPGCEAYFDLETIQILEGLLNVPKKDDALDAYYTDFLERHDRRPTAMETFHDGYSPKSARKVYGSWLGFVDHRGGLSAEEKRAFERGRDFLSWLETTRMTKSYKMQVLLAMLDAGAFPGEMAIEELVVAVKRIGSRSAILRADFGVHWESDHAFRKCLVENPIAAWTKGRGAGGVSYFHCTDGRFGTTDAISHSNSDATCNLVRELVDWRLAAHLRQVMDSGDGDIICKVSHANGQPILFYKDNRTNRPDIPLKQVSIVADDRAHVAHFVKIAINKVTLPNSSENRLPDLLRGWFGDMAGQPGTNQQVVLRPDANEYIMEPLGQARLLQRWSEYIRKDIPPLLSLEYNTSVWNQGFVVRDHDVFLFVTLEKDDLHADHQYDDGFQSPTSFRWQSQNRTKQDSKHGCIISQHTESGHTIHLFIRRYPRVRSKTMPFVYCGELDFVSWQGDGPISVRWELRNPVPERLWSNFKIPGNVA